MQTISSRVSYSIENNIFRVKIGPSKSFSGLIFLGFWIFIGIALEIFSLWMLFRSMIIQNLSWGDISGGLVFLGFWLLLILIVTFTFFWELKGKEIITLVHDEMLIESQLLGIRFKRKSIKKENIKNIQVFEYHFNFRSLKGGKPEFGKLAQTIEIVVQPKNIYCGGSLNHEEAQEIVNLFKQTLQGN